jgi:hypothetical protein
MLEQGSGKRFGTGYYTNLAVLDLFFHLSRLNSGSLKNAALPASFSSGFLALMSTSYGWGA